MAAPWPFTGESNGGAVGAPPPIAASTAQVYARAAGALYLIVLCCGVFSDVFVRSRLIEPGAASTADNLLESQGLFRTGFVSELLMIVCDVALAVVMYLLLRPVSKALSLIAAAFLLVHSAILGANLLNHFMAVRLLRGNADLGAFDAGQLEALILLSVDAHKYGDLLALVFFAVHLSVLGFLLYKSGYFPRVLGVMASVAAGGYLADSLMYFLLPDYEGALSPFVLATAVVAELAVIIWLLARGVDQRKWSARARLHPVRAQK